MKHGSARPRVHLFAVLSLCACTAISLGEAPIEVKGREIPSYEAHEECLRLQMGDRVEFVFESTTPVDFNFHYHEGNAVVMPLAREKVREDAGVFAVPFAQDYCLMWEAGAAGTVIDYRVRVKRAGG